MSDQTDAVLERLRKFRQPWNEGDVIDEDSGLTAADLDAVIKLATAASGMVSIRSIDLSQAAKLDGFFEDGPLR